MRLTREGVDVTGGVSSILAEVRVGLGVEGSERVCKATESAIVSRGFCVVRLLGALDGDTEPSPEVNDRLRAGFDIPFATPFVV